MNHNQLPVALPIAGILADFIATRCRYKDCPEHHSVAAENEKVTCPTCRATLGLNPECEVDFRLEREALSGNLESARELAFFERYNSITTNLDACPEAAEAYEIARAKLLNDLGNDDADDDMGGLS